MRVIVFTGMNGFPERVYLDPNVLLADMRKAYPGAKVELVPDKKKGNHSIKITGHKHTGPMGEWTGAYTLGFRVLTVRDPQNWGKE